MNTAEKNVSKHCKAVLAAEGVLLAKGYVVKHEAPVSAFLDRKADLVASRSRGVRIVVEVKSADYVDIGAVEQVQQLARSLGLSKARKAVGLLVATGEFDGAAQRYAAACSPRVFLAAANPKQIGLAVDLIAADVQGASRRRPQTTVGAGP